MPSMRAPCAPQDRRALSRFANNVSRATDYLVTQGDNPEAAGEAEERPPPAGLQNLFAELLRARHGPDHGDHEEHDEEPPADAGIDS